MGKIEGFRQAKRTLASKGDRTFEGLMSIIQAYFLFTGYSTVSHIPAMNGSQKHVDYTPLKPVDRSDDELAALEGCVWFDIGECAPALAT